MKKLHIKRFALLSLVLLCASLTFAQMTTETIDGLCYKISKGGKKATLIASEGQPYAGRIIVPEKITASDGNEYPVVAFADECFLGCSDLESVQIPNSVTKLGERCFMNCSSLTEVNLPASITELPVGCFGYCASLKQIDVPSTVTSIGSACFMNCTNLSDVTLPRSIQYLPEQCFSRCQSLKTLKIPSSVTAIADYCFYRCVSLDKIYIPFNTTEIGAHCFENCTSLRTVEFASTVNLLYDECFSYCYSMESLYFNGDTPDNLINSGARAETTLYVPEEHLQHFIDEVGSYYKHIETWATNEGVGSGLQSATVNPVVVASQDGVVALSGLATGEQVRFYSVDGKLLATVCAIDGTAICTPAVPVVIAHVGGNALKIVVK